MALRKVINNPKAICSYYYDKKQEKCFYQINVDGKHVFTLEYMENLTYALPYLCKTEGFSGQKCCVEYTNNPQYLKEFVNDLSYLYRNQVMRCLNQFENQQTK